MIILHPAHPRPYLPSISLSDGGGLQVIKEDIFTPHSAAAVVLWATGQLLAADCCCCC